eukprot:2423901-Amphidinium_carterae.1
MGVDGVKYLGVQRHNGKTKRVGVLRARSSLAGVRLQRLSPRLRSMGTRVWLYQWQATACWCGCCCASWGGPL